MGIEIERKFLVLTDGWRAGTTSVEIRQGYLSYGPPASVRVRVVGERANINIKKSTLDIVRDEFEYEIPLADAEALLGHLCTGYSVRKIRHSVIYAGNHWVVDEFLDDNAGLVVAELELNDRDQSFEKPAWLGQEVSGDARYLNTNLSQRPFGMW